MSRFSILSGFVRWTEWDKARTELGQSFGHSVVCREEKRRKDNEKETTGRHPNFNVVPVDSSELLRKEQVAKMDEQDTIQEPVSDAKVETQRDRVRRLFSERLNSLGFRRHGNVKIADHDLTMVKMIDALTYMSNHSLNVLFDMLKSKGQGRDRDIWPSRATIVSFAELIEPRAIEELPSLIRWFRSVEGPKALHDGTLVETWQYFQIHKRPPISARRQIENKAKKNAHTLELYRERIANGRADPEARDWVDRYEKRLAYCKGLLPADAKGEVA